MYFFHFPPFFYLGFFFFFCVLSFLFIFSLFLRFRTFGKVQGNARDGRWRHPPTNQSLKVCKVAPSILWLTIPGATGLVFLPASLLQPLFLGENTPTIHVRVVLFPSFSKALHGAPFAPRTLFTANSSVVVHLLPSEGRCGISGCAWRQGNHVPDTPGEQPSVRSDEQPFL